MYAHYLVKYESQNSDNCSVISRYCEQKLDG